MEFEYMYVKQSFGMLDLNSIGNCYIEAFNDKGMTYYLWIKTDLGVTKVLEAGPYIEQRDIPLSSSKITYEQYEYSQSKLVVRIKKFLNNPNYAITQAIDRQEEYNDKEKIDKIYNIVYYMEV